MIHAENVIAILRSHTPNEHRVGAITLDHCNGFRNVYRNPSAFGYRDIFLESLPVFRIGLAPRLDNVTAMNSLLVPRRIGDTFRGTRLNATVETEMLAIVK